MSVKDIFIKSFNYIKIVFSMKEILNTQQKRIDELEDRIKDLEEINVDFKHNPNRCRKCGKGVYLMTGKKRATSFLLEYGDIWQCTKCGHIATEELSEKLSEP